ncbi:hypothetical protein [Patulibacter sp. SYSU D01012]|uniref:hypothetical protein n=1 Tax=Patulibacter sp. SYSU D01012 TaxID=2817381 RepID=UPI001B314389|nr:hypothetical protein [Patulibacter sp. SYSU D01012]
MSDPSPDFFDDLEHVIVDAARTDNRRRRRRRTVRAGTPLALAVGVTVLALGGVPTSSSGENPLSPVAHAAEVTSPSWSRLETWNYALDTTVAEGRAHNTATYGMSVLRRSGERTDEDARSIEGPIATTTEALTRGFDALRGDGGAPGRSPDAGSNAAGGTALPVPAREFPTSVEGVDDLVRKTDFGTTCGEKAMHLAADVLREPGVSRASRRAMVLSIGRCPDVRIAKGQRDLLGRPGTTITAAGAGSGLSSTSELTLDAASAEPLSLVERTADAAPELDVAAGTVMSATAYRYDGE